MEKVKTIYKTTREHTFYCDKCNSLILSSIEYDDGYYEEPYRAVCGFYLANDFLEKDFGCLCKECLKKEIEEHKKLLISVGFKKRGEEE